MNGRIVALASAAMVAVLLLLSMSGCTDGSSPELRDSVDETTELRDYLGDMRVWFDDNQGFTEIEEGEDLLGHLRGMEPPSAMRRAHKLLLTAYGAELVADKAVRALEYRENTARPRGDDEIRACVNRGLVELSLELDLVCRQRDAAFDTYLETEMNWVESLAKECDLGPGAVRVLRTLAISQCLARQ